jgi:hypothetical protein
VKGVVKKKQTPLLSPDRHIRNTIDDMKLSLSTFLAAIVCFGFVKAGLQREETQTLPFSDIQYAVVESKQLDKNDKKAIYDMYAKTYSGIGVGFPKDKYEAMFDYYPCGVYVYGKNQEISGALLYWQTTFGNKVSLVFGPDSTHVKTSVLPLFDALLKTKGWYSELSEGLEHVMRKKYEQKNIQKSQDIHKILGSQMLHVYPEDVPSKNIHKGQYLRYINPVGLVRKGLYGIPCKRRSSPQGCHIPCSR